MIAYSTLEERSLDFIKLKSSLIDVRDRRSGPSERSVVPLS